MFKGKPIIIIILYYFLFSDALQSRMKKDSYHHIRSSPLSPSRQHSSLLSSITEEYLPTESVSDIQITNMILKNDFGTKISESQEKSTIKYIFDITKDPNSSQNATIKTNSKNYADTALNTITPLIKDISLNDQNLNPTAATDTFASSNVVINQNTESVTPEETSLQTDAFASSNVDIDQISESVKSEETSTKSVMPEETSLSNYPNDTATITFASSKFDPDRNTGSTKLKETVTSNFHPKNINATASSTNIIQNAELVTTKEISTTEQPNSYTTTGDVISVRNTNIDQNNESITSERTISSNNPITLSIDFDENTESIPKNNFEELYFIKKFADADLSTFRGSKTSEAIKFVTPTEEILDKSTKDAAITKSETTKQFTSASNSLTSEESTPNINFTPTNVDATSASTDIVQNSELVTTEEISTTEQPNSYTITGDVISARNTNIDQNNESITSERTISSNNPIASSADFDENTESIPKNNFEELYFTKKFADADLSTFRGSKTSEAITFVTPTEEILDKSTKDAAITKSEKTKQFTSASNSITSEELTPNINFTPTNVDATSTSTDIIQNSELVTTEEISTTEQPNSYTITGDVISVRNTIIDQNNESITSERTISSNNPIASSTDFDENTESIHKNNFEKLYPSKNFADEDLSTFSDSKTSETIKFVTPTEEILDKSTKDAAITKSETTKQFTSSSNAITSDETTSNINSLLTHYTKTSDKTDLSAQTLLLSTKNDINTKATISGSTKLEDATIEDTTEKVSLLSTKKDINPKATIGEFTDWRDTTIKGTTKKDRRLSRKNDMNTKATMSGFTDLKDTTIEVTTEKVSIGTRWGSNDVPKIKEPTAPFCNATSIFETSANITCDITQNTTNSCPLTNLTVTCAALDDNNRNVSWIVREGVATIDLTINDGQTTYLTLDELSEFTNYTCTGVLNNVSVSDAFYFSTLEGVPSKPQNFSYTTTSTSITLTWNEPEIFPGSVPKYKVQITTIDANHYICDSFSYMITKTNYTKKTEYTYSNVLPDVNYNVSVLAVTSSSVGEAVWTVVTTNSSAPENVRDLSLSLSTVTTISWTRPCNTNGPADKFILAIHGTYSENETITDDYVTDVPYVDTEDSYTINIDDLKPSFKYDYNITVVNMNTLRNTSETYQFISKDDYPGPPTVDISEVSSDSFNVTWQPPEKLAGKILSYNVTVNPLGPVYTILSENCDNFTNTSSTHTVDGDVLFFYFTDGMPYSNYTVYVVAKTSIGYGPPSNEPFVITDISEPDPPTGLTQNVSLVINAQYNCEYPLVATWDPPCRLNGDFDGYRVILEGTYTEEDNITYLQEGNVNVSIYEIQLNASFRYDLKVQVKLANGWLSQEVMESFSTSSCYPGHPISLGTTTSATNFTVSWEPPTEKRGKITNYYINVTAIYPGESYSKSCNYTRGSEVVPVSGETYYYEYSDAIPFYNYLIDIFAATDFGNGSSTSANIMTEESVPDKVTNITFSIDNPELSEYKATAYINFLPPCYIFGSLNYYAIESIGERLNYPPVNYKTTIPPQSSSFSLDLQPEYYYTVRITIHNTKYYNTSYPVTFTAPAGVPELSSNVTAPTPHDVGIQEARLRLRMSDYNSTNGDILYLAIIISDQNVTGGDFGKWNETDWPEPHNSVANVYYQASKIKWMPFSDEETEADFIIGNDTSCNTTQYCNKPLKESTEYFLIVRVFTRNFYKNNWPVSFTTASTSKVGLIVGLIFGLAFVALVLFILYFLWTKEKLRCRFAEKIYARHMGPKISTDSPTNIPINKFVSYCRHLENNPEKLKTQYQLLGEKTKEDTAEHTNLYALLTENRRKNRYSNILPFDETRVKLFMDEDDEIASDYINASYIRGYGGNIQYIATQGPLPDTCRDFWKMVLQENVTIIIMVSHFIENNKVKCHKYFPNNHESMIIDDIEVRCSTELQFGTYCVRTIQVQRDLKQVHVTHLQFLDWPDFGVPQGTENILQFCYQFQERLKREGGCVVVHCSAGVGRTGTIIATDILLRQIKAGKKSLDVFKTVLDLRMQRVNMVQTEGQYMYIHSLVKDHLAEMSHHADHPLPYGHQTIYENLSVLSQDKDSDNIYGESKF